jgi:Domain of unknown function (DUF5666)
MNTVTKIFIGVIATAVVFFYAGVKYNESHATPAPIARSGRSGGGAGGNFGGGAGGAGGGFVAGTILSIDAQSITVSVMGGGSKVIFVGSSTPVEKAVSGTFADLTTGENVTVTGSMNSDGSYSARSIQIR